MKAINKNQKYALPLLLLGLLALDTDWQRFLGQSFQSGSFASNSAEDVRRRAGEVCKNRDNYVSDALSVATRQGEAEFYFRGSNNEDIADTLRVEGESAKIEYNGRVTITRVTSVPAERHRIRSSSRVLEHFGDETYAKMEKPVPRINERTGEPFDNKCELTSAGQIATNDRSECQRPKYHVYQVRVTTQTTEGDWCDDCDNESAREDSDVRYIEVQVSPRPDTMTDVCRDTFTTAQSLFETTEKDMKKGIVAQMKEIAELAEDKEMEEYREQLENECRIRPGKASLDDIRKYRENRSIDEDLTFAGEPKDRAECVTENMRDQDGARARQAYFRTNMVPLLQDQLTSADPAQREMGRELLNQVRSGSDISLTPYESGHLSSIARGSQQLDTMYRLTAMVERTQGTPQGTEWQMRLDQFRHQVNMEYSAMASMGSPAAFEESSYWHNKMLALETTTQYNIPAATQGGVVPSTTGTNTMSYNLAGRGGRLAQGHLPLSSEFEAARARISNTPDFVNRSYFQGGTDAYETRFSTTRPPGNETSGSDRLVRNRM